MYSFVVSASEQLFGAPCCCCVCGGLSQNNMAGNVILSRLDRYGHNSRSRKELVQYLNPSGWVMSI